MASIANSTFAPVSQQGPVTRAQAAMRNDEPAPPRRSFLRGLLALPLIGGGVTLIGAPTAVAEPVTRSLIDSYDAWLYYERRRLKAEKVGPAFEWDVSGYEDAVEAACRYIPINNGGFENHFGRDRLSAPPSTRAALVLSAVGADWRT